jgi:GT2 family glycosyltransferase
MDLSIIIVNFNVSHLLDICLESIHRTVQDKRYEIIVIDNASTDGSIEMLEEKYPTIVLVKNKRNEGFSKATNQGIRLAEGSYVLLLNPDTVVTPGSISQLIKFFDQYTDVGIVGPKLLNHDGTLQPSCRSFPNLINMAVFSFLGYEKIKKQSEVVPYLFECWDHSYSREVDFVIGAAIMTKKAVFETVGYLDEDLYFYGEEKEWSYRVRKAGFKIYFHPEAKIVHYGGQSSKQVSLLALYNLYRGHKIFLKKH